MELLQEQQESEQALELDSPFGFLSDFFKAAFIPIDEPEMTQQFPQFQVNGNPEPSVWLQTLGLPAHNFVEAVIHGNRVWLRDENNAACWIHGVSVVGGIATINDTPQIVGHQS